MPTPDNAHVHADTHQTQNENSFVRYDNRTQNFHSRSADEIEMMREQIRHSDYLVSLAKDMNEKSHDLLEDKLKRFTESQRKEIRHLTNTMYLITFSILSVNVLTALYIQNCVRSKPSASFTVTPEFLTVLASNQNKFLN